MVQRVRHKVLTAVDPAMEEPQFDRLVQDAADPGSEGKEENTQQKKRGVQSVKQFCALDKDVLKEATEFNYFYGPKDDDCVQWKIMGDQEFIHEEEQLLQVPTTTSYKDTFEEEINFNPAQAQDFDFNKAFFDHFFPSIKGHAKIMDKILSSPDCSYFATANNDNIKFFDPKSEDPDYLIRVCYTLLIAAATEVHHGVDNLWKQGPSTGRHPYPDFGKYIPQNYFKCFMGVAHS